MRIAAYSAGITDECRKAVSDATRTPASELSRNLLLLRQAGDRPDVLVAVYGAHALSPENSIVKLTRPSAGRMPILCYVEYAVLPLVPTSAGELQVPFGGLPGLEKDSLLQAFAACSAMLVSSRAAVFSTPLDLYEAVRRDIAAVESGTLRDEDVVRFTLPHVAPLDILSLLANPRELQVCTPRRFEELVAELLTADGWDVELVRRVNAPGPDIIAASTGIIRNVPLQMIVECKRYADGHPVDVDVVRKVMYWVNEDYRATLGMIATTNRFTSEAVKLSRDAHFWRLNLKDQAAIIEWMRKSPFGRTQAPPPTPP